MGEPPIPESVGFTLEDLPLHENLFGLAVSTVVLLLGIILLQAVTSRFIRKRVVSPELRRKWLVQSRNGIVLLLVFGIIFIWGSELRSLALSVVALAVAMVVATKELIVCITGTILKTGGRSFKIGDRIQIKDYRGDVIDQTLLTTTIMEIGPGKLNHQRTGRITVIPNSLFVSEAVINESYTHAYVLHVFIVPFKRSDKWQEAQKALLKAAQKQCRPYLEDVRKHMKKLSDQKGFDPPLVDPRVTIQVPAADEIHLIVRVPVKATQRGQIEQAILWEVFTTAQFSKSIPNEKALVEKPEEDAELATQ
ncbi:MAG TPA: mechanosensitive ion channel domain-containing protein [Opitutales bacterium]|nr:mechanosensitive ion channel domain-containing protein [Opitutales bacterium]